MIRDNEISRLTKYAQGLGLKVSFSSETGGSSAAGWVLDGSEIIVYTAFQRSKTETILSLIHEIAHHVWFIHEKDRQPDLKFSEAIERQNLFEEEVKDKPAPKKLRKKILATEIAGTIWWETIYKDTDMKFPKWKLYAAMEMDVWAYEVYAETGSFPDRPQTRAKAREINTKHKGKYE